MESDGHITSVRDDYSGRGMCGDKYLAIVPATTSFVIGLYLGKLIEENYPEESKYLVETLFRHKTDSVGSSEVVYFTGLSIDDLTKEQEDSDE